jgi:protein ExsB
MAGGFADKKALVLFSGGQDSTTCLAWALKNFKEVETVGFDYGQRHTAEITCRKHILETIEDVLPYAKVRLGQDHMIDMKVLGQISECSLTREIEIEFEKDGVPNSFVPARNLLFFTFASAIAYRRGGSVLVGGMCETDYSGYADCRDNTLKSLQVSLSLGLDRQIVIETPLMWLTKAETWQLAHDLGGDTFVEFVRTQTHTCYMGNHDVLHEWGYGCGECPACKLRQDGWEKWVKNRQHAQ